MNQFFYKRDAVPVGEKIELEIQYTDAGSFPADAEVGPSIQILDASSNIVLGPTTDGVYRTATGRYKYQLIVPDGYTEGLWNDIWAATIDGYNSTSIFDFKVNTVAYSKAVGASVPDRIYALSDPEIQEDFSQEEIKGILRLRKYLKMRMRNTAYKPDGTYCPLLADDQLDLALCSAISEFNATPILTAYGFDSQFIQTVCSDLITQGAMLICWAGQAVIEAGFEFTISDNGVTYNPPPVSSTITGLYGTQLSDYRAKLKEIKRNLRPHPRGMGAGSFGVQSPRVRMLRNLKEKRII